MTIDEFSTEFDTLLNSYASKIDFGNQTSEKQIALDEYEKSVFLTKAQEQIVRELYTGKNQGLDSFEKNEETRRNLSNLIETYSSCDRVPDGYYYGILSEDSVLFELPEDVMDITYEQLRVENITEDCNNKCKCTSIIQEVVPITQDEFIRTSKNPFRGLNKKRAFRLDIEGGVELVTKYSDPTKYRLTYTVRYLKFPEPIILIDLSDSNLSINNIYTEKNDCKLSPNLHRQILERAVLLALVSKQGKV